MRIQSVSTSTIKATARAMRKVFANAPEPLRAWSRGVEWRLHTEVFHRNLEAELARRGYARAIVSQR